MIRNICTHVFIILYFPACIFAGYLFNEFLKLTGLQAMLFKLLG